MRRIINGNPVFATAIAALQNAEKEIAAGEAHYQAVLNSTKGAQLHLDACGNKSRMPPQNWLA